MMNKYRLIGLTGTNGAGKGEIAAYLATRGYAVLSLSDVIRDRLQDEGLEAGRDNLIAMGNALRREHGPDILARLVLEKVRGRTVIDSIRNPQEVATLKRQDGFVLVAVDAPPALRFDRVGRRGRNESAGSIEAFLAKESEEMGTDADVQQIHLCLALADIAIMNDGTLDDLHRKIEEVL